MKGSKSIRERSKNFLQQNLIEILDEWCREAKVKAKDKEFHVQQITNSTNSKHKFTKKIEKIV